MKYAYFDLQALLSDCDIYELVFCLDSPVISCSRAAVFKWVVTQPDGEPQ